MAKETPKKNTVDLYLSGQPELRLRAYALRMRDEDDIANAAKKLDMQLPADFTLRPIFLKSEDVFSFEVNHSEDYLIAVVVSDLLHADAWLARLIDIWDKFKSTHCAIIVGDKTAAELGARLPEKMAERIITADTTFESISQHALQLIFDDDYDQVSTASDAPVIDSKPDKNNAATEPAVQNIAPATDTEIKKLNADNPNTKQATLETSLKSSVDALMQIKGAIACAIVNSNTGIMLAYEGEHNVVLDLASQGNASMLKASSKVLDFIGSQDHIEDILITLSSRYHIVHPLSQLPQHFIYLSMDKSKTNLALARLTVQEIGNQLK